VSKAWARVLATPQIHEINLARRSQGPRPRTALERDQAYPQLKDVVEGDRIEIEVDANSKRMLLDKAAALIDPVPVAWLDFLYEYRSKIGVHFDIDALSQPEVPPDGMPIREFADLCARAPPALLPAFLPPIIRSDRSRYTPALERARHGTNRFDQEPLEPLAEWYEAARAEQWCDLIGGWLLGRLCAHEGVYAKGSSSIPGVGQQQVPPNVWHGAHIELRLDPGNLIDHGAPSSIPIWSGLRIYAGAVHHQGRLSPPILNTPSNGKEALIADAPQSRAPGQPRAATEPAKAARLAYGEGKKRLQKAIIDHAEELAAMPLRKARAKFLAEKVGCSVSLAAQTLRIEGG
jgi:hypothetical protein